MKAAVALTVALLSAAAQAAFTETVNGVTYTVKHFDADGSELPVEFGAAIDAAARAARRRKAFQAGRGSSSLKQRSQTFDNWCGAANLQPPGGGDWNSVSGKWTVPNISLRPGQSVSDPPSLIQSIGIGGDGCLPDGSTQGGGSNGCQSGGIIGGGTGSQIGRDGKQENFAYVEFWPEAMRAVKMHVNAGDEMFGRVTTDSAIAGNVTIINITTGQCMYAVFTDAQAALSGSSVQWTVSAIGSISSNKREPFADFADNNFSECQATTDGGQSAGPGTNNINLMQNGRTLCTGRIEGSNVYLHSSN
ncbi:Concanavalin A-like lectin/glucanase [Cordyceps fumosorosea ARSEF 2679]|uniref:Concanavalin A-like lectin/glucanase n=1 Tax=Cordyceps fumosorosea (strain ARSEF 2679) TaxID=1081104 RepID=A0A162MXK9_CORFA|nr:Concanavalin A-like lectin/glucanase [Cordyceps fumosorosea ARSEF 2679]OAA72259.1 Concanavalin A-like lectin/glucanase [Cordyceps fumosorosea ARSEF 2679]